jgi:RNA polymerase primary sigma factor
LKPDRSFKETAMEKLPFVSEERSLGTYLREIARVPLLTPDEEKTVSRAAQKGDEEALRHLTEANLRFVVSIAKAYRNRGLSFLDLINEGNLGLMKAAKTFDPERGVRFVSYAVWWIRQSILAAILDKADMVRIPQSQTKKVRKIQKRMDQLKQRAGGNLSDVEFMRKTGLSRETLDEVQRYGHGYLSLDTTQIGETEKPLLELIRDPKGLEEFEKDLMDRSLTEQLQGALKVLDRRDGEVLAWRYGLDGGGSRTLDEIGKRLKISKERVRQIEERAMRKIRGSADIERLRDFVA